MGYQERREQYRKLYEAKLKPRDDWHRVTMVNFNVDSWMDAQDWLRENCTGKYTVGWVPMTTAKFVDFEVEQDATWFALKWG